MMTSIMKIVFVAAIFSLVLLIVHNQNQQEKSLLNHNNSTEYRK